MERDGILQQLEQLMGQPASEELKDEVDRMVRTALAIAANINEAASLNARSLIEAAGIAAQSAMSHSMESVGN